MRNTDVRGWAPDVALAVAVAVLGLFEAASVSLRSRAMPSWLWTSSQHLVPLGLVAIGMALAVGLCRRFPLIALVLVWAICGLQLMLGIQIMLVQVAIAIVAFATTRWGRPVTVMLSGLSVPAAMVVAVMIVHTRGLRGFADLAANRNLVATIRNLNGTWQIAVAIMGLATLGLPWLAGLVFRFGDRARVSRLSQVQAEQDAAQAVRDSEQAREIARLRNEQARLARDVHDVVGHSLAVILAQAEAGQYLEDADTQALKLTMANIATSARTSLQDVRQVLSETPQPSKRQGLDTLIEGLRSSGHTVISSEVGISQPLPPELEVVAFRVLQEMLTNAIKHGRRDQPVWIERHWEGELRIEVRNVIDLPELNEGAHLGVGGALGTGQHSPGHGLEGMRRRLESVGGRLDVRRREEPVGSTFTATAWMPVRTTGVASVSE